VGTLPLDAFCHTIDIKGFHGLLSTMTPDSSARRPLKSRSSVWAQFFAKSMLRMGMRPNAVSLFSIVCAAVGGGSAYWATQAQPAWAFWFLAAFGIQMRLFCNLMDGLLAVEGGLKSATGDLYNEIPDRLADAMILIPLGYAGGTALSISLGWAAGCGAVFTAYIRALGAAHTRKHDFCGPMAKPHRMAAATLGCLGMMATDLLHLSWPLLLWTLIVINAGILITSWRRIRHLAADLNSKSSS
jgi:phosphatidylglycerophosphate synthase